MILNHGVDDTPDHAAAAEPVRRTSEIEELSNLYVIHPIASALTPVFARLGIPPNAVSIAGMAFGIAAGIAYSNYQDAGWVVAGFILMILWHVMDGADGQLARLMNAQSQSGKILDGICDYVTFIAVYTGLAIGLSAEDGKRVWLLVVVAGVCHAVQAAAYEVQRQAYNYWGWGRKSATLDRPAARPRMSPAGLVQRLGDALFSAYIWLQHQAAGGTVEFHERFGRTLELQPERAAAIRRRYREVFAPKVRRWSVMSSNYRTLGIFLCALAGAPIYYFWIETIGFSALLIVLLALQPARNKRFLETLETVGD